VVSGATGRTVTASAAMIGFIHFHILARPADYTYPCSGFINLVYLAEADAHLPETMRAGDVEVGIGFRSLAEVLTFDLSPDERLFLQAALDARKDAPR